LRPAAQTTGLPVLPSARKRSVGVCTGGLCVIMVQVKLPDGKAMAMGLVEDGVEEVINLAENDIEETPNFGGQICTDYIVGIAKVKGAVKSLLDIDGIVGADTLQSRRAVTASVAGAEPVSTGGKLAAAFLFATESLAD
jgi:chemotaxis signal transduction protein